MMESGRFEPDGLIHSAQSYLMGLPVHLGEVGTMPDGRWVDLCALALEANRTSRTVAGRMAVSELAEIARNNPRFGALNVQSLTSADMARPVLIVKSADGDRWLLDGYRRVKFALTCGLIDLPFKEIEENSAERFLLEHTRDAPAFARIEDLMLAKPGELIETWQERRRTEEALGPVRPPPVEEIFKAGLIIADKPRRTCLIDEMPTSGRITRADKDNVQVAIEKAIARVFYAGEVILRPALGRQAWIARLRGANDVEFPKMADKVRPLNVRNLPHTRTIVQIISAHEDRWRHLDHRRYLDPARGEARDTMAIIKRHLTLLGIALRRANEMAVEIRKLKRKAARAKEISQEDLAATNFDNPGWKGPEIYRNLILIAHSAGFNPAYLWQQWQYLSDPLSWIVWGSAPVRGDDQTVTPPMAEAFIHQRLNAASGEKNVWSEIWAITNGMLRVQGRLDEAAEESIKQISPF